MFRVSVFISRSTGQSLKRERAQTGLEVLGEVPHPSTQPVHVHRKDSHNIGIILLFFNSAWVLQRPTRNFRAWKIFVRRDLQFIVLMQEHLEV